MSIANNFILSEDWQAMALALVLIITPDLELFFNKKSQLGSTARSLRQRGIEVSFFVSLIFDQADVQGMASKLYWKNIF